MAITLVSRANDAAHVNAATSTTTPAQAHAAGNLLVAVFNCQLAGATISSVGNTAGDTWTPTTNTPYPEVGGGVNDEIIYYVLSTVGNASDVITITLSAPVSYLTATVFEFHSSVGSFSYVSDSPGSAPSGTAISTGVLTLSGPSVIVAQAETDASAPTTPGPGYTLNANDGFGFTFDEYHITSTSEAATATANSSAGWGILAAAFKEVSAAAFVAAPGLRVTQAVKRASLY
jgi:hypothetical protein